MESVNIRKATISTDGFFRFTLTRIWDVSKPLVLFIMLNPSIADANKDDPTIRRLIGFAERWGAGGFHVGNLFPYRETCPKMLHAWLSGQILYKGWNSENVPDWMMENIRHLESLSKECGKIVCAWGVNGVDISAINDQDRWPGLKYNEIVKLLRGRDNLYHMGLTINGEPRHPLYLPYSAQLTNFI